MGDRVSLVVIEFGLAQQTVDFVLGTATANVQAKVRDVLRKIETELKGETMSGVLALVSPEFFDRLIGHAKVEDAYKYYPKSGGSALARQRYLVDGVRDVEALPAHPAGEQPLVECLPEEVGLCADSFGGRVHVEWDPRAAATPLGQLPFFIEFLKLGGLVEPTAMRSPGCG